MYAVGRLITQGVYTVSGPFHPFGGAVDMVVVQQQDGSLKSSPWYVRFGKFQGVLKAKERVVDINVNGVDADFHMYLDPRGEAYFLREIDSEEVVGNVSSRSSLCGDLGGKSRDKMPVKSKSMGYEFDQCDAVSDVTNGAVMSRNNSKRSRLLGFVLGRRSMQEHTLAKEENDSDDGRRAQLESAEIAADLLEMRWSTNLSSRSEMNVDRESINDNGDITGGRLESSLVLHEQHFADKLENVCEDNEVPAMEVEDSIVTDVDHGVNKEVDEVYNGIMNNFVSEEISRNQIDELNEPEVGLITAQGSLEIVPESYAEESSNLPDTSLEAVSCSTFELPLCQPITNEIRPPLESTGEFQDVSGDAVLVKQVSEPLLEEPLVFDDLDDSNHSVYETDQEVMNDPDPLKVKTYREHLKVDIEELKGNIRRCPTYVDIPRSCEVTEAEIIRRAKSLPNMWSQFNDPVEDNHEEVQFYSPIGKFNPANWDLLREEAARIKKANLEKERAQGAENLSNDLKDDGIAPGGPDIVDGAGGSWSLWPFRRMGSKSVSESSKKDLEVDTLPETPDTEKEDCSPKLDKMHTRALTPTPEQLASLNLAEGQNTVTFTFSTSVLGAQKVDARIYLWRWDTRIVISDVDGTITKSDVLGQFMPLVGRDWSHIGVTHLFSGIKENGYQMLYLSARAISQASLTRQFLFNLKQDGKALPDGPVVISPDGLFPSLFREVIRRAPHEFKIACLEDIKACFPSDRNPFYAGFGNRDTDEFSYLKVGIAKGKIFIINPKGEVIINRCIDSKSYASLHALVHGIFPPISVHEEEDYNSWNFWKLPPPTMD